jgi:hypothetical protein
MIVTLKGQGPGAAHAVPRPGSGPPAPTRGGARSAPPAATPAVSSPPAGEALFDANDDGTIENWSFLHGGDSFATLDPPPPGTDTSHPRHNADSTSGTAAPAAPAVAAARGSAHNGTPAAIHHAHDAYRRDGMAGAPGTRYVVPGLASHTAAVSVPQPAPAAALRSTG